MGLKRLLKRKKYPFKVFLNGKEVKGTETIKEGDKLVNIDKIEGEVYKFQSGISWNGVDSTFKEKVIKAMCELYCMYKEKGKSWTVLEISSAYRTEREQSVSMVDYILVKGQNELTKIYTNSSRKAPLTLISSLYYDGNHLICKDTGIDEFVQPCKHGAVSSCKENDQHSLLNQVSSREKDVFDIYTKTIYPGGTVDLKKNTAQMKDIIEKWLKVSGMKSDHQLGKAIDFGSNNASQYEDFKKVTDSHLFKFKKYDNGNFHIGFK